jgi:hypothetical protein
MRGVNDGSGERAERATHTVRWSPYQRVWLGHHGYLPDVSCHEGSEERAGTFSLQHHEEV